MTALPDQASGPLKYLNAIYSKDVPLDGLDTAIVSAVALMFTHDREWAPASANQIHQRTRISTSTVALRLKRLVEQGLLQVIGYWRPDGKGGGALISNAILDPQQSRDGLTVVYTIDLNAFGTGRKRC